MIPRQEVFIFTDSTYALGAARGSFTPRTNRSAVRRLQTALDDLRKFVKATLAWVPGHAFIRYNEEADQLAKRGAAGITSFACPIKSQTIRIPRWI